jgi:hypothetical protein
MQGIYKLEFKDGSIYVGQARDIRKRWAQHLRDMEAGKHHNKNVQAKFKELGFPSTEVLEYVENIGELDAKERSHIQEHTSKDLLNIAGNNYFPPIELVQSRLDLVNELEELSCLYSERLDLSTRIDYLRVYAEYLKTELIATEKAISVADNKRRVVDDSISELMRAAGVVAPRAAIDSKVSHIDVVEILSGVRSLFQDISDPKLQRP